MIISAVLLPNASDQELLVQTSSTLNEQRHSLIQLGENALPHVTLLQLIVDNDEPCEGLWQDVASRANDITELQSTGLASIVSEKHGQTWVELQFEKTAALEALRQALLLSNTAQKHTVHNPDVFRPHCTLALLDGRVDPEFSLPGMDIFNRPFTDLKLAVGVNGENFTFSEVRFQL